MLSVTSISQQISAAVKGKGSSEYKETDHELCNKSGYDI